MPTILHLYIKNIDKLVGIFWDTGNLNPWQMLRLIESKKFILEYKKQYQYQLPQPLLEKKLEKIDEVRKEYNKDIFPLPSGLKKAYTETKDTLTIEDGKKLLREFIKIAKNLELGETSIKSFLQMIEQMLLGKYE